MDVQDFRLGISTIQLHGEVGLNWQRLSFPRSNKHTDEIKNDQEAETGEQLGCSRQPNVLPTAVIWRKEEEEEEHQPAERRLIAPNGAATTTQLTD